MDDFSRLIEHGFPLREASLASLHDRNVRHGHISTLHIWPARRPLPACRAAIIATLLPDPGDPNIRSEILRRLAGVAPANAVDAKEIDGGILVWGRESEPAMDWFREQIRKAFNGRAPRVLDPFAGGGAIPFEAMRLGCDTSALDLNPVAWFVLKCTLEYPHRFAGKRFDLPSFAREDSSGEFVAFKNRDGDLSSHVKVWGEWVLDRARLDLASYYPESDGKHAVAYLWARTVKCKNCRGTIPLLKTRWLCKKKGKYIVLTMRPNATADAVEFGIERIHVSASVNAKGTMTRKTVDCPLCPAKMTMDELRLEGRAGRMGETMTAVVVDGPNGKEYRLPTAVDLQRATAASDAIEETYKDIPFGIPTEPTPKGGSGASRAFSVDGYGLDQWCKLFTPRQLLAFGIFAKHIRTARSDMSQRGYTADWTEAITAYLCCAFDKALDYGNTCCSWYSQNEQVTHLFNRYALPIKWDFVETSPIGGASGSWRSMMSSCLKSIVVALKSAKADVGPKIACESATRQDNVQLDAIITDPPYYDAIPYAGLMDFFYVWLRRILHGLSPEIDAVFHADLSPKWDYESSDGELIDDSSRFAGNAQQSKQNYEDGMFRAFEAADRALAENGRMAIVFAHKDPDAWETLVSAMIRAGFVVDASWPIATEMANRTRALASAALASSIWLICRKRPAEAMPGWDERVEEEMTSNITIRLREYWDAGIRGPDFVWSAIGPALEAYSKYPVVKKLASPGQVMTVAEFLAKVRREVVTFAAGRVLHSSRGENRDLDGLTTYYLLHRHDFGFEPAAIGASILYAVACDLSDAALISDLDLLMAGKVSVESSERDDIDEDRARRIDRSTVNLKQWDARNRDAMGFVQAGRPAPLIDRIHRLMHLWSSGDRLIVNAYISEAAIDADPQAHEVIQAIIELCTEREADERSKLEAISNHLRGLRPSASAQPSLL